MCISLQEIDQTLCISVELMLVSDAPLVLLPLDHPQSSHFYLLALIAPLEELPDCAKVDIDVMLAIIVRVLRYSIAG
jgi:hypothetical protein